MRIIADLHVHSKYARATSAQCDIKGLSEGAKTKGITLMASGDFTHPAYFQELRRDLEGSGGGGIYEYGGMRFILSTEVSVIYGPEGHSKKMHHILLAPSLESAAQVNDRLARYGDLKADGRPTLMMSSAALVEEMHAISPAIAVIPAHAWTPWFSVFGSRSGVDSIEEAFGDQAHRIFALETGLSSDPAMNWLLSPLDKYSLISNSDAHSPGKLGREANVFELGELSFDSLIAAIRTRKGFVKTYEFYPEEGKYHYDGHRNCSVLLSPWEARERNNLCPVCRRKLTIGVLHRVADLADRKPGFRPEGAVPFQHIVPLTTVISKALRKTEVSAAVAEEYYRLIRYFGSEFAVFEAGADQVRLATSPQVADAISRVNEGRIRWIPGHDGVFGELVLDDAAPARGAVDKKQRSITDF